MKRVASVAAAASLLLAAASAGAQGVDEFGAYGGLGDREHFESPQNAAFELRFGRYLPNVDDEFNGAATPFEDTFGNDMRWLVGFEVDWQLLRIPMIGTLGPGFGWGYTKATAKAPLASGTGRSDQKTTLEVMPMYLVGVLRLDVVTRETDVPLLPWAKLGLGYALWWSGDGSDTSRDDNKRLGRGTSYGYQYALGIGLLLDALDPESAIQMDANTGVNNSYLFAEWYVSNLDGFGGDRMQVGTNTWMIGLALEM